MPEQEWEERALLGVMIAASALAAFVVLSPPLLPLTDLAQHEAQLALWARLDAGETRFADLYRVNWFTPYLAYYLLGRALQTLLSAEAAARCVLALGVVALPWSLRSLLRRAGGDPAWAVAGFPLAFGFAFSMGFLNYVLAVPLGFWTLAALHAACSEPSRARALQVAALSLLLFFTHALMWGVVLLAGSCVVAGRTSPGAWGERARRFAPLAVAAPPALIWLVLNRAGDRHAAAILDPDVLWIDLDRVTRFPEYLLGQGPVAAATLLGLIAAVTLGVRGVSRDLARWGPAAVAAALYAFFPWALRGTHHLSDRLANLPLLLLLCALLPRRAARQRRAAHLLLALLALSWLAVLGARFHRFSEGARAVDEVLARVPPGAVLYNWSINAAEPPFSGDPHRHLAARVQLGRDALVEPTFARNMALLVRYVDGRPLPNLSANPVEDVVEGPYTHLLIRAEVDVGALFPGLLRYGEWREVCRSEPWFLYRRTAAPPRPR